LCLIAEVFEVSVDNLINSGGASNTEKNIISSVASGNEISPEALNNKDALNDIINIAPYLKVSTLSAIAEKLSAHSIDISKILELAEFMNDDSVNKLLENGNIDSPDDELLEKLLPFLGQDSMFTILDRIMKGENSDKLINIMRPYFQGNLISLVEAAVIQGILDYKILKNWSVV